MTSQWHTVYSLPDEILLHVFLIGEEQERSLDLEGNYLSTGFAESVASVCSRWRRLSIAYPLLWRYVTFNGTLTVRAHAASRLTRSSGQLIHIKMDYSNFTSEDLALQSIDQEFRLVGHFVNLWRSLYILLSPELCVAAADRLMNSGHRCNLETVTLKCTAMHVPIKDSQSVITSDMMPNLRNLTIIDIRKLPFVAKEPHSVLSTLRIHSFDLDDAIPSSIDILQVLANCPNLRSISIRGAHPPKWDTKCSTNPSYLSELETLTLEGLTPDSVGVVISSMVAPKIHTLEIRFHPVVPQDHFDGCNRLAQTLLVESSILKTIKDLRLAQFACGWEYIDRIFAFLDNVSFLTFECRVTAPSWLFRLLVPRSYALSELMSSGDEDNRHRLLREVITPLINGSPQSVLPYLPNLNTMHIAGVKSLMLQQAMQCRVNMRAALQDLYFDERDTIAPEDLASIQKSIRGRLILYDPRLSMCY